MREYFKTIKRYRVLFAIEILVIIAIAIFIIEKMYGPILTPGPRFIFDRTDVSFGYGIWWISQCIADGFLFATTPTVFVFTLIRYIIYDNKNQKIINNSFPISNHNSYLIEIFLGGIPIAVTTLFYIVVMYFFGHFKYTDSGQVWNPQFGFESSVWGLAITLLLLGTYTFLVFARKVSSSIGGMILLYVVSAFLSVFIFGWFFEPILYGKITNNTVFMLAFLLIFSIPFAVSIIGLMITSKKIDIAKGGTYYFMPVQIAVCIMSGASFLTWMLGFFDSEKGGLNPIYITISVIISLIVTVCVFFLTKAKGKATIKKS